MAKQNLYKLIIVVAIVFCLITLTDLNVIIANAAEISVNAQNGSPVAKVGNVEYSTIDEAIANWTAGKTLTLLADVKLSDVIKIKSTENHILDLSTYTITAADGKNAIEIVPCGNGDAEKTAINIKADGTNPGGINAGKKSVIYYNYSSGGISVNDRPIIDIDGGVFTGGTSQSTSAGIYVKGAAARQCATINISGGTFNCAVYGQGKSKLIISGGLFNYTVASQGDSTAYRLISGGTFKTIGFMTTGSSKFTIGTAQNNYNVGVHVDENGYIAIGGPVIQQPGEYEASTSASTFSSYLQYSSAKENQLYYETIEQAIKKTNATITVYTEKVDLTGSSFKGTFIVPEGQNFSITYDEGSPAPTCKIVSGSDDKVIVYNEVVENGKVILSCELKDKKIVKFAGEEISIAQKEVGLGEKIEVIEPSRVGYTFAGWYKDDQFTEGNKWDFESDTVNEDITLYAKWTRNIYTLTLDYGEKGIGTKSVSHGDIITAPDFNLAGCILLGWYDDAEYFELHDFSKPITGNLTIYASIADYLADIENINNLINNLKGEVESLVSEKAEVDFVNEKIDELADLIDILNEAIKGCQFDDVELKNQLEEKIENAKSSALTSAEVLVNNAKMELSSAIAFKADSDVVAAKFKEVQSAITTLENLYDDYISADVALMAEFRTMIENTQTEIIGLVLSGDKANAQALEELKNSLNQEISQAEKDAKVLPTTIAGGALAGDFALLFWILSKRKRI